MTLKWTRRALRDMQHLHDYMADDNPAAARRMVARIREAASHLRRSPQMGKRGRVKDTRELVIAGTPYRCLSSRGRAGPDCGCDPRRTKMAGHFLKSPAPFAHESRHMLSSWRTSRAPALRATSLPTAVGLDRGPCRSWCRVLAS